jgi:Cu2+-exporting ATPase
MRLVARGVQDKPQIVQFADKVGRWFILVLSFVAVAVFAYWSRRSTSLAIDHTVALLIVTCPCVLGLATPLTIAIAIGRLARKDILVKSAAALERLSRGGNLLLDKTGTLTEGRLDLLEWIGDERLKAIVGEMERSSNHPVGRALREGLAKFESSAEQRRSLGAVVEKSDGGITCQLGDDVIHVGSERFIHRHDVTIPEHLQSAIADVQSRGCTAVVVGVNQTAVAVAALGDRVRTDSRQAVAGLRQLGWSPSILSGDAQAVVRHVADQVGIETNRAFGHVLPEEKLRRVRESDRSAVTVMVGDGVNDAAALAAATVGIAVHGGAEASLAAADVYVARPGLAPLIDLMRTSRRAMRTVHRNLVVSLSYNLLAGALAAAGLMTPLIAAIIMPISSATVLSLAVFSISRDGRTGGASWK